MYRRGGAAAAALSALELLGLTRSRTDRNCSAEVEKLLAVNSRTFLKSLEREGERSAAGTTGQDVNILLLPLRRKGKQVRNRLVSISLDSHALDRLDRCLKPFCCSGTHTLFLGKHEPVWSLFLRVFH